MSNISKSEGYITYRRNREKWTVRYPEYDIKNNRKIMKSKSCDTKEEAEKYLASIMYQRENPIYIKHNGIPFCELMRSNLKLKLDTNQISEVTYHRVLMTIEQIEKFPISKKNIDKITSDELQEFMNYHKYMSNSSINKLYQQLGTTFKIAINKGYLMRNPMINVLKPKSDKEDKKVRALTFEEQQLLTEYLMNKDIAECRYKNVYGVKNK